MTDRTADHDGVVDILVYSDNRDTRGDVMRAVGRRVGKGMTEIRWTESATYEGAYMKIQENKYDLLILDGEAAKLGGIGLGKMVRDEIDPNMPFIILIARPQDEWLARVSKPNGILPFPVDAKALSQEVARVLSAKVVA